MPIRLILKSIAIAFAAMVLNVAAAFGWVFLYSMLIAPGHDEAFYQAYAMRAAPWCSVVAGMPILFGAGWLLARWHGGGGWRIGIGAGIAYAAIDLTLILAMGAFTGIVALSAVTKLGASALGGRIAR